MQAVPRPTWRTFSVHHCTYLPHTRLRWVITVDVRCGVQLLYTALSGQRYILDSMSGSVMDLVVPQYERFSVEF